MAQVYNGQLDAFDLYHKIQESPEKAPYILGGPALPALGHAIAGSTGAAISNVCTYPLALIITRLQIQRQLRKNANSPHSEEYKSIRDAAKKIYTREGGINGFYIGVVSDTSKTIADSFLFFLAYNFLRQTRIQSSRSSSKHLPVIDELGVGFLAGALSKFLTTPVANIVTRKQTSSMLSGRDSGRDTDQGSLRSIASQIRAEKGVQGFWSGYSASLVLTLNPSLTFFFFEAFKRTLLPRSQRQSPSPQATFLLAAISKAMASTITYPFSLAKSRLQSSSGLDKREGLSTVKLEGTEAPKKAPSNVFTVILRIAQTEGLGALYEGLGGEVMKGFFSHGITMIVKEAVHKLVIQLYYSILTMLKKYPSPQELAVSVKGQAVQVAENVEDLAGSAKEQAGRTAENIRESAESTKEQAGRMAESIGQHVKQTAVSVETQAGHVADSSGNWTYERAASAKTQAGQMADNLGDWTQEAAANVAENLGERKQQAANMATDGIQVVKEKSRDLATEANARPKKTEDT
ncbi:hypothetical protein HO133_010387 [Letharia lupina]|uniref:Peroxisomal adenine nucleotide transporter 1 n=1 Tax=Letharia lupina TaxID=560253 RepID=A0A8H6CKU4_9LECA|nr:uncharacterized protein HO133_010387 [Letharia lupina]KAF6225190.1 hypothetical protein HO133_010387 [Letharia lupina]